MAYQLLISRAKVISTHPDGSSFEVATRAAVSVRNGVATVKATGFELTMPVASVEKGRRSATVTGVDGTVWTVARAGCGCGGGR